MIVGCDEISLLKDQTNVDNWLMSNEHPPQNTTRIHIVELVLLLAIVLLAAWLRLGYPGVNPFAADEARLSVLALEMAQDGEIIRYGIANSAGSRNLPASVYAFVPPYWFTNDPLIATQYVGVLNVLAVLALWWATRALLGRWPALAAALFFAAAPYAVFFSRNIWTQNLLAPFAAYWLAASVLANTTRHKAARNLAIAAAMFLAGFAFQVHLAGAALGLATLYGIVRWRWWRDWPALLVGGGLAALALVPFLYEAACCSPELIEEYLGSSGESGVDAQALGFGLKLALNREWDYLAAGQLAGYGYEQMPQFLSGVLLILGVIALLRTLFQREREQLQIVEIVLLLLLPPILLFTYHRAPVRLHYMLTMLPGLALLVGFGMTLLKHLGWRFAYGVGLLVLAAIWTIQASSSLQLANEQVAPGGINTPLLAVRDVVQAVPEDGIIVAHTQSEDIYGRGEPAIWKVLLWDRPHRITSGWSTLILPPQRSYLMMEVSDYYAWHELRYTGLMDENFVRFDPLPGAPPYYMQPYDGESLPPQMIPLEDPITFDSGLRMIGWYSWQDGAVLRVSIVYEALTDPAFAGTLQQFAHLRRTGNTDVQPAYIQDVPLTNSWRAGDHLIALVGFFPEESAETFTVTIGQYLLETGTRFLHDGEEDSVLLEPIVWEAGEGE